MTKQAPDMTPRIEVTEAFVANIVAGMSGQIDAVAAAKALLDETAGRALPFLIMHLQEAPKVTEADWASTWAAPALAGYMASGRYKLDAKGVSLSARSAVSALKVCVIALTNGITPGAGDSLFSFTTEARKECAKRGLIAGQGGHANSGNKKAAERKSPQAEASKATSAQAAAFVLADKDLAFATKLELAAGDYREEFEAWFDAMMARQARRASAPAQALNA